MSSIERTLSDQYSKSGYAELAKLSVTVDENGRVVTLRGRVSSYYLKQRAQEVAKLVVEAHLIRNLIDVAHF
ncbi:BON domain-containing protein [Aeoliella sp.]|uniref:BON domain-containing protein n=1 Tax=Aeoliella sp. TaxID=2795800 RepID=UPI003CCBE227